MKAITSDNGVIVPYLMIVSIWVLSEKKCQFYDTLGRLHGCSDREFLLYQKWLSN
jgi:hypothetical protein